VDSDHKSRAVPFTVDFEPQVRSPLDDISDDEEEDKDFMGFRGVKTEDLERLKGRLPLHHAVTTWADFECLEFCRTNVLTTKDATEWKPVGGSQDTIIRIAACNFNPRTLKWLIENIDLG
jgi:hypothetical protein